jgi:putative effector of murein hydrolase
MGNYIFSIGLTLVAYLISRYISKKVDSPLANIVLLGSIFVIAFLLIFKIPIDNFKEGSYPLTLLFVPATASFALPIYKEIETLKKYFWVIVVGCSVGAVTSIAASLALAHLFDLDQIFKTALVTKSVTSAIALELAALIGGEASLAVLAVSATGISGIVIIPYLIKIFKIDNPLAQGIGFGTTAHVMGTSKASEYGLIQAATGGIAIVFTSIVTMVVVLTLF